MIKDYYEILGVPPNASFEQIRKMYHGLALLYHPDTTRLDPAYAQEKMKVLIEAYEVLSDPRKRAEYDLQRENILGLGTRPRPPRPQASPTTLDFGLLRRGETLTRRFTVTNLGGPVRKINFICSDEKSWFRITKVTPFSAATPCPLAVEVTVETRTLCSGQRYVGWVIVDFDGVSTRVSLGLWVAAGPEVAPLSSPEYLSVSESRSKSSPRPFLVYAGWRCLRALVVIALLAVGLDLVFKGHRPDSISELAWSPDGRAIAYIGVEEPATLFAYKYYYSIYRIDSAGSRPTQVAEYGRHICSGLQWTPEGLSFLVKSYSSGEMNVAVLSPHEKNVDVSAMRSSLINENAGPLSPDGQRIAFASCTGGENIRCHIYSVRTDNSNRRCLTPDPPISSGIPFALTWSPDGRRIAFLISDSGSLYVVNADGSTLLEVAGDVITDGGSPPSWSPDGERIAYASEEGIKMVRLDGTQSILLASGDYHRAPAWSPDGQYVAFAANQRVRRNQRFMLVNVGTLETRCLSCDPRIQENALHDFAWSPDGQAVAFAYVKVDEKLYWLEGANIYLADVNTHSLRLLTGSLL
jgi:Tol biopolymer transport system component